MDPETDTAMTMDVDDINVESDEVQPKGTHPNVISRQELQDSDDWRLSVGKKLLGVHYRERGTTRHAVCPPRSNTCYIHEDDVNAHDAPIRHLIEDAPEVLAFIALGGVSLALGPRTAKKLWDIFR